MGAIAPARYRQPGTARAALTRSFALAPPAGGDAMARKEAPHPPRSARYDTPATCLRFQWTGHAGPAHDKEESSEKRHVRYGRPYGLLGREPSEHQEPLRRRVHRDILRI